MKLVKRKTRKAIEKSVRKAMKKHGPALVAAVAGSLASSIATLAGTESADKRGKSKLAEMVDRAKAAVAEPDARKLRRQARRESGSASADDLEDTQLNSDAGDRHPRPA